MVIATLISFTIDSTSLYGSIKRNKDFPWLAAPIESIDDIENNREGEGEKNRGGARGKEEKQAHADAPLPIAPEEDEDAQFERILEESRQEEEQRKTKKRKQEKSQEEEKEEEQKIILESRRALVAQVAKRNRLDATKVAELAQRCRESLASDFQKLDLSNLGLDDIELIFTLLPDDKRRNGQSLNLAGNSFAYFFFSPEIEFVKNINLSNNKNLKNIFFSQDEKLILRKEDKPVVDLRGTGLFNESLENAVRCENQKAVVLLQKRGYTVLTNIPQEAECIICLEDKECGITTCCGIRLCIGCYEESQKKSPYCTQCNRLNCELSLL